ncbi:diaminopimelate epimerase, partial [Bacillus stratosphericus]
VYNRLGGEAPDIETGRLKAFYEVIQQLVAENKLLAYHDRSDGGLFAALAEMAFAARCGLDIRLDGLLSGENPQSTVIPALFNEELGAVLQIRTADAQHIADLLEKSGLAAGLIGRPAFGSDGLSIRLN